MKLLVWDDCWTPYADVFRKHLLPGWTVASSPNDPGWLIDQITDADALVAVRLPAAALPHARNLKAFLFPGAGLLVPDPAAYPAGCPVANVYEHETPVAEYALMTMLLHATRLLPTLETFRAGRWDGSGRVGGEPHGELSGATIGIFGYGHIGQAIAARARAFGMRIATVSKDPIPPGVDFAGSPADLPGLLRQSDYLVIAAPLTPETEGRIGAAELALLRPHAMLVNVSRAEIVCEQPLYDALANGRIAAAALDVWYQYPPSGAIGHGSRLPFHTLPNVVCTPHYCAWSRAMIERRIARMADNLNRLSLGQTMERIVLTGSWRP